jgi:glycosyltransferase involved in cell wall biosynthesis
VRAITRAADMCMVANEYLAAVLRKWNEQIDVVPMALDGTTWHPPAERLPGPVVLGWSGAPPNLIYLRQLSHSLAEVQRLRPGVEIVVYSGTAPAWDAPVRARHVPFAPGTEADVVRGFDIGLLPLPDNAFAAGKSPIKALQYAACAIPCVAFPVGATTEIVREGETGLLARNADEWTRALCRLIDDRAERRRLGENARAFFLARHEHAAVARRLADVLRAAARRPAA